MDPEFNLGSGNRVMLKLRVYHATLCLDVRATARRAFTLSVERSPPSNHIIEHVIDRSMQPGCRSCPISGSASRHLVPLDETCPPEETGSQKIPPTDQDVPDSAQELVRFCPDQGVEDEVIAGLSQKNGNLSMRKINEYDQYALTRYLCSTSCTCTCAPRFVDSLPKAQVEALPKPGQYALRKIFDACDTDSSGMLDEVQALFALQSQGFYLTQDVLENCVSLSETSLPLDLPALERLIQHLEATNHKRDLCAVPYARRGMTRAQLKAISSPKMMHWVRSECDEFNAKNAADIASGCEHEMAPNLYTLDKLFIRATTSPDVFARKGIPLDALEDAGIPDVPQFACRFSQVRCMHATRSNACESAAAESGWVGRGCLRVAFLGPPV